MSDPIKRRDESSTDGDHDRYEAGERTRSGRALVATVFIGAVLLAGVFGYFIGSIGTSALGAVGVFGVTLFETTPVGMALYGMTVTGLVLGLVFLGAWVATRWEDGPPGDQ